MNTRYKIKGNEENFALTDICNIGIIKREGDEWLTLKKTFTISSLPELAAIRFDSRGVSAVYVNGSYIASNTGRYANRITNAECTSRLKLGENEIKIVLGGHYYQTVEDSFYARRKARFSSVAACLELISGNETETVSTDPSWVCESDLGVTAPQCFSQVTVAEYDRFWLSAALWKEEREIASPDAIANTVKGYKDYISAPKQIYAEPCEIVSTNMERVDNVLVSTVEKSTVLYRFDKIYCGYVELEYEAESDGILEIRFDYTGYPEDIDFTSSQANISAKRLTVKKLIRSGRNTLTLVRRRAPAAYMSIHCGEGVKLLSVRIRLDMLNHDKIGYFNCSDPIFSEMWEIGKYTHHINKHQEYESCPKNEMKYFTGDGILAALVDAYTFGEGDLTISSLSYTEITSNVGLIKDRFIKNIGLWEYPAWRIVHAYNHYFYFNDTHLAREHFDELAGCLEWMIGKMNAHNLIYQYPIFSGAFCMDNSSTDFTQHPDRLGERPLHNAMLYKALMCMSSFAEAVGDCRAEEWRSLAEKVKKAINDRLWSEEKQAYYEPFNPHFIPHDGNALCLLFGIAEGERAEAVLKTLREKLWTSYGATVLDVHDQHKYSGNATVSPPMNTYEAEARFLLGDGAGAIELMRRCWGSMMAKGAKSFWEYANANDDSKPKYFSSCHAWSAGCTYLISAYVLGIRPAESGYEKLLFAPQAVFDGFSGVVPTPKGLVAVKYEGGTRKFTLVVPENCEFQTNLPSGSTLEVIKY